MYINWRSTWIVEIAYEDKSRSRFELKFGVSRQKVIYTRQIEICHVSSILGNLHSWNLYAKLSSPATVTAIDRIDPRSKSYRQFQIEIYRFNIHSFCMDNDLFNNLIIVSYAR